MGSSSRAASTATTPSRPPPGSCTPRRDLRRLPRRRRRRARTTTTSWSEARGRDPRAPRERIPPRALGPPAGVAHVDPRARRDAAAPRGVQHEEVLAGQVAPVVVLAPDPEGAAEVAGAAGGVEAALDRLRRPDQHRRREAGGPGDHVHAVAL